MRCCLLAAAIFMGISGWQIPAQAAQENTEIDAMIAALEKAQNENAEANPEIKNSESEQNQEKSGAEEKSEISPQQSPAEQKSLPADTEETEAKETEEVVILDVFSPEFMADLQVCKESSESKNGRTLEIVGMKDKECYLTYGNYVLKVPVNVLTNIHSFDDLQLLLKNKDMARYKYVPEYTYEGLVFALAACAEKKRFYGIEEVETRVDAVIVRGLSADYFDGKCEVYLQNELELEGEMRDYGVTCKIEQKKLDKIKPYFADVVAKYKDVNVIESHENKEILNADIKLMHYLQQNNYCRRNNMFLD